MIINFILFIISFLFMEFVAWSNHKYVMHGFMWSLHRDHHENTKNRYLLAVKRAHDAHHRPKTADDFDNFGLLIFSQKYFK